VVLAPAGGGRVKRGWEWVVCDGVELDEDGVGGGGTKPEERALDQVHCRMVAAEPTARPQSAPQAPSLSPQARCAEQAPVETQRVVVHRARGRELGGHRHGGGSW